MPSMPSSSPRAARDPQQPAQSSSRPPTSPLDRRPEQLAHPADAARPPGSRPGCLHPPARPAYTPPPGPPRQHRPPSSPGPPEQLARPAMHACTGATPFPCLSRTLQGCQSRPAMPACSLPIPAALPLPSEPASYPQPRPAMPRPACLGLLPQPRACLQPPALPAAGRPAAHVKWAKKVVLAYSGGLDTSVIVPWLRENYGCEVVCFTADVGQGVGETEGLEAKAKESGASQLVIHDLKEEFVKDFIYPCLRAGAVYERKYLLGTSMARPVIAKAMVDVAKEVGADAVAHGCTGKGNDQVRFELTFFALNPKLQVVAPWREWDIKGREDAIEYAKKFNVPVPVTKKSIYSRDRNLWHLSHEGDILEDPANEPKKDMYLMTVDPEDAPNTPEYVEIELEAGIPVSLNGERLSPANLLAKANEIGGQHGVGRIDMVENRLVGMKSRGVYETPGGTILTLAARELETLTLDRETMQLKDTLAIKYAELVYAGRWFDPLRESLDAFMEKVTETTTGRVKLKLFKGSATVVARESPNSLYRQDISSFEEGSGIYDQGDAAGFIRLYGLPTRVRAMLHQS